ncbi:hypothetical protein LTR09_005745 [Extremus antarcticus]|uniref:Prion-inhibition and propagation HeLo domain-containing protein n=1 Tax=Extremus antarcticus TaxID=702011 RepID=A0AAJ0GC58_9PEZI|nr:hypothetical protein LTR09_005745 [Extremus antarcticus]
MFDGTPLVFDAAAAGVQAKSVDGVSQILETLCPVHKSLAHFEIEKRHNDRMEAAGLAFGILSVFNTVLQDLHLLHAVRNFGTSYHTSARQLANAQLRLSRRGEAVGLTRDDVDQITENIDKDTLSKLKPDEDRKAAKENLESMKALLAKAHEKAKPYEPIAGDDDGGHKPKSLTLPWRKGSKHESESKDNTTTADSDKDALSEGVLEITLSRRPHKTPLIRAMRWALYDQPGFERLARMVLGKEELRQLGAEQVRSMLSALKDEKAAQDDVLRDALKEAHGVAGVVTNNFGAHNRGIQTSGSFTGGTFNFGGS